jgi:hypothetical protein
MLETSIIIITCLGIGFLAFCIRACYMSKCRKITISLKGIEIERDTSREQNVSQLNLQIPGMNTGSK